MANTLHTTHTLRGLHCSQAPAAPATSKHGQARRTCKGPLPDNRVAWQHKQIRFWPGPKDWFLKLLDGAYLFSKERRRYTEP